MEKLFFFLMHHQIVVRENKVKTTTEKMPYPVRTRVTAPAIHKKTVVKGGLLFSTLKPYTYSMNSRIEFLIVKKLEQNLKD